MKKILLFILTFSMIVSFALPFTSVAAEEEAADVIEIDTAEELAAIENNLAGNYKLTADIVATTGITGSFTGTFDGDGHKVSGLTTALFDVIGENNANIGTVKDVVVSATIVGVSTSGTESSTGDFTNPTLVGILSNKINPNSVVDGVTTLGSITWDCAGFSTVTGGITGMAWAEKGHEIFISNCTNKAELNVSNTTKFGSVGGIVGFCAGHGILNLTRCVNEGNLTISGRTSPAGIIGRFYTEKNDKYVKGMIVECANLGDITITSRSASPEPSAGITGNFNWGLISKCYNVGQITDSSTSAGLIGYANNRNWDCTIEYCYNLSPNPLKGELWGTITQVNKTYFKGCYYISTTDEPRKHSYYTSGDGWAGKLTSVPEDPCEALGNASEIFAKLSDNGYVMDPNVGYPILPFQLKNLTLEHTEDDGSSFFYQQNTTDASLIRVIGLLDAEVAKSASAIEVTFSNGSATKVFTIDNATAYSSIDATFDGVEVTYVACDGAVILGWVFKGVPENYVPTTVDVVK